MKPEKDENGLWHIRVGRTLQTDKGRSVYPDDDPRYFARLARADVPDPELIVLGFDGSKGSTEIADTTALAAIRIEDRFLHTRKVWEPDGPGWEPPRDEIDAYVTNLAASGRVVGMRGDQAGGWADTLNEWANRFAPVFWSNKPVRIGNWTQQAFTDLYDAIDARTITVDPDDDEMTRHLLAARKHDGKITKDHRGRTAQPIDLAAAAAYAYQALQEALEKRPPQRTRRRTEDPFG